MHPIVARTYAVLSTTAPRLTQLAESTPADLFDRPPAPGEWSALECRHHLVDTEQIFPQRVASLRHGQDIPAMQPFIAGSGAWQFYFAEHQVGAGEE